MVRSIRKEIDRLPAIDRAITLLWLRDRYCDETLVSDKELLEVCKRLGPDRLLDLLRRKPLNTDPDIYPGGLQHLVSAIHIIIFPNAQQLFRPKDADAILACASLKGNYPWADWFIVAANLQPKRAKTILELGWNASQNKSSGMARMRLMVERWRLVPEEGTALILKRFWDETPHYEISSLARYVFFSELGKTWKPRDRQLVLEIVRDKRFATLDGQALLELGYLVNRVEKKVIIEPEELKKATHPFGLDRAEWPRMESEKRLPKETAELKRRLEIWRGILRKGLLDP